MERTLTLAEAAPILQRKNARSVRKFIRDNPTVPWRKIGGKIVFLVADLEEWIRHGYSEPARKLLKGEPCLSEEESGGSALAG